MRTVILAALFAGFVVAPLSGCMSKRAKRCLKESKAAQKAGGKAQLYDAYGSCKLSCTHDKNKEVCKAKDELKAMIDKLNKKK